MDSRRSSGTGRPSSSSTRRSSPAKASSSKSEGCLSLPGFEATVPRPARVSLTDLDRDGCLQTLEGEGLLARAIQHEVDHLDGVLFIDRLRGIIAGSDLAANRATLAASGAW